MESSPINKHFEMPYFVKLSNWSVSCGQTVVTLDYLGCVVRGQTVVISNLKIQMLKQHF